jgi:outer membrane lipoprotein-sorting protein
MRITRPVFLLSMAIATSMLVPASADGASSRKKKRLSREELVSLFGGLTKAAGTAKTLQAAMKRSDVSGLVIDDKPLVSEGNLWIERPARFRQDITKPRPSVTVASEREVWVYFPEAREAQYIDISKGIKGKKNTTSESILPWLTFDLPGLEKKYQIAAKRTSPPQGVKLKVHPRGAQKVDIGKLTAIEPKECYKIDFVPKDPRFAPGLAMLSLWVDGVNPWPLKIERESTDGDIQTTEFSNIVLEAPVDPKLFDYRPPRGTKIENLSG